MLQVVIFVKSVPRSRELNRLLNECNFPSICIHSGMKQEERMNAYKVRPRLPYVLFDVFSSSRRVCVRRE